jgi:hypothetical protein
LQTVGRALCEPRKLRLMAVTDGGQMTPTRIPAPIVVEKVVAGIEMLRLDAAAEYKIEH